MNEQVIIHLADTHIQNSKNLEENKLILSQIVKKVKNFQPLLIVHTGDLFDVKQTVSPEALSLANYFLGGLADVAPVLFLVGNHDAVLSKANKPYFLRVLVKEVNQRWKERHNSSFNSRIYIVDDRKSKTKLQAGDFRFGVFSSFKSEDGGKLRWEEDNVQEDDDKYVKIALYHGNVGSEFYDGGIRMNERMTLHSKNILPLSTFRNYDYGMFGHIHDTQPLDKEGRFWYAGSSIQMTPNEDFHKYFLLWDYNPSLKKFDIKKIPIPNPVPKISLFIDYGVKELIKKIKNKKFEIPENTQLKVTFLSRNILKTQLKEIERLFESYYELKSVDVKVDYKVKYGLLTEEEKEQQGTYNYRSLYNVDYQNELIVDYIKNVLKYEGSDQAIQDIVNLNNKFHLMAMQKESEKERVYNSVWEVIRMEWSGLFGYDDKEIYEIDFSLLKNGITGILGKNRSGKSSILDILAFGLFGKTGRKARKNIKILNKNSNKGYVEIFIKTKDKSYKIERSLVVTNPKSKKAKKVKGELRIYEVAKDGKETELSFDHNEDFKKALKLIVGEWEDFKLMSYATQFEANKFVEEGSAFRRDFLKKVMGLDVFDTRIPFVKDEIKYLKKQLKEKDSKELQKEYENLVDVCKIYENKVLELKEERYKLTQEHERVDKELIRVKKDKDEWDFYNKYNVSDELFKENIKNKRLEYIKIKNELKELNDKVTQVAGEFFEYKSKLVGVKDKIKEIEANVERKNKIFNKANLDKKLWEKKKEKLEEEVKRLEEYNLGCEVDSKYYRSCDLVKNLEKPQEELKELLEEEYSINFAYKTSLDNLKKREKQLEELKKQLEEIKQVYEEKQLIYETVKRKAEYTEKRLGEIAKEGKSLKENYKKVQAGNRPERPLEEVEKEYNEFLSEQGRLKNELQRVERELEYQSTTLYQKSAEKRSVLAEKDKIEKIEGQLKRHEIYLTLIDNKTGIVSKIMRELIPVLNNYLKDVLEGLTEFQVEIDFSDKDLDVNIINKDSIIYDLELGSGFEQQIAGIAIRLALVSISQLIKSKMIFFDEPFTALDNDNLGKFEVIMSKIKERFDSVFIITHLEEIKDYVDNVIFVDKDEEGRVFLDTS